MAGIIHFDGAPVEPGQIERMTSAMAHRGPDGINHWVKGSVALGQCMLRTTPESLEETQPLTNEDASLVLLMDGRVDNFAELRRELLGRGSVLRNRSDAELVLRAYEVWGEACPDRIIGECVFFIWDARQRRLFAARDAAGTRHFYYHTCRGWFAFASEIKGLLAIDRIEPKLNESRVFDYLVPEFDRDDVIGTFYQDILRLPAGHAMAVTERGVKTWRYWNPGELSENRFASLDECAEAFLEQMRIAVKCRLRSIGPVGAMLSGGLDSSSIVGLIRKECRNELSQPLRTFSLIREDRENCKDWEHIQHMLKDGWVVPTLITSASAIEASASFLTAVRKADEPFQLTHGLSYALIYESAQHQGCSVVLDGMASDIFFHNPDRSLDYLLRTGRFVKIPALLGAYRQHSIEDALTRVLRRTLSISTPQRILHAYRRYRDLSGKGTNEQDLLRKEFTTGLLDVKRSVRNENEASAKPTQDLLWHARLFTSGLLSFAHEMYGQIALSNGVEPRSPFSDRRMIEFAIRMPTTEKLFMPWYKPLLRRSMGTILPSEVRWRRDIGNHPGWRFYEGLIAGIAHDSPEIWHSGIRSSALEAWVERGKLMRAQEKYALTGDFDAGFQAFTATTLAMWLDTHVHTPGLSKLS